MTPAEVTALARDIYARRVLPRANEEAMFELALDCIAAAGAFAAAVAAEEAAREDGGA